MNAERSGQKANYSIAVWTIKPGREDEFVSTWRDFAAWTAKTGSGALEGTLVQDMEEPRRFFCFWPFEDDASARRWRADPKFREFMMHLRAFCEDCRPSLGRTVGYVDSDEARRMYVER